MLIVFTTVSNPQESEDLAKKIVKAKLAACVQILPQMKSVYFWENEVQVDDEHLLLIKTLEENFPKLETFIQANHSYDVPEIVAVPAKQVSENYLDWIKDYLQSS